MYKLEIFDGNLKFISAAAIDSAQEIEEDYLAAQPYSITLRPLEARKGWYTHITDGVRVVADGLVNDVQRDDKTTVTLSIKPLTALMDCQAFTSASIPDVDAWLEQQLRASYISTPDVLQRRPLLIDPLPIHPGHPMQLDGSSPTVSIMDVARRALTTYGVACSLRLDFRAKGIRVQISQPPPGGTLEADLDNVLGRSVTLGDSYGAANKMAIRQVQTDKDTGTVSVLGQTEYFLHPDGTVDTQDRDRITPVFWDLADLENSDTWAADAQQKAEEALKPLQYDQCIELTYRAADQLTQPLNWGIGAAATVLLGGAVYRSIVTGRRLAGNTVTLIMGTVRQDLTKKLLTRG